MKHSGDTSTCIDIAYLNIHIQILPLIHCVLRYPTDNRCHLKAIDYYAKKIIVLFNRNWYVAFFEIVILRLKLND